MANPFSRPPVGASPSVERTLLLTPAAPATRVVAVRASKENKSHRANAAPRRREEAHSRHRGVERGDDKRTRGVAGSCMIVSGSPPLSLRLPAPPERTRVLWRRVCASVHSHEHSLRRACVQRSMCAPGPNANARRSRVSSCNLASIPSRTMRNERTNETSSRAILDPER